MENGRRITQFISTSKLLSRAKFYAKSNNAKIVEIDLCKIDDAKIVGISDGKGLVNKGCQKAREWAIKDREVLIRGPIPSYIYRIIN